MSNRFSSSFIIVLVALVSIVALIWTNESQAESTDIWQQKVDSAVIRALETNDELEFVVLLKEADLSGIDGNKEERGAEAVARLTAIADESQSAVINLIDEAGATYQAFWLINMVVVQGDAQLLSNIANLPEVETITTNGQLQVSNPIQAPNPLAPEEISAVEWGITNINADDVWLMGFDGSGIVIAGQDTGYEWDHDALKEKYRGWDGTTADHNYNWHDAINTSISGFTNPCGYSLTVPCDDNNHGTHTMGTMVGDDGTGNQIGVAPGADWIGCRNMDSGYGLLSTYVDCFQWFVAPTDLTNSNPDPTKAPDVINNSWGCPPSEGCNTTNFATLEAAVDAARAAGIVVVASAGNSGSSCSTISNPPGMFNGSFTVGATNSANVIAGFSSRGPVTADGSNLQKPDVSAPGVNVRSSIRGNAYSSFSGTSMAGPHVAGAVALLIDAVPSLSGNVVGIEQFLRETAVYHATTDTCGGDTTTSDPNHTYGHGIIDVHAAILSALTPTAVTVASAQATTTPILPTLIFSLLFACAVTILIAIYVLYFEKSNDL